MEISTSLQMIISFGHWFEKWIMQSLSTDSFHHAASTNARRFSLSENHRNFSRFFLRQRQHYWFVSIRALFCHDIIAQSRKVCFRLLFFFYKLASLYTVYRLCLGHLGLYVFILGTARQFRLAVAHIWLWDCAIYADFCACKTSILFSVRSAVAVTYIRPLWDWSYDGRHDWWCDRRRFTSDCIKICRKISRGQPRLIARPAATSGSQSQPVVRLVTRVTRDPASSAPVV